MKTNRTILISLPSVGEEEWQALKEPIESGWLTQGPKVAEFERKFAELHQVKYAIATSSCTTGLHLILAALEIGPGDEVIVPAFTWISTANVVMYCGAKPVFVDVDPITYNIDPTQIADKITNQTKAIIPVHLFGLCADIDEIKRVAPEVPLIEDAACAAGGKYKNRPAGSLGVAAAFSSLWIKMISITPSTPTFWILPNCLPGRLDCRTLWPWVFASCSPLIRASFAIL